MSVVHFNTTWKKNKKNTGMAAERAWRAKSGQSGWYLLAQCRVQLLFCLFTDAARVVHKHVCIVGVDGTRIAHRLEHARHALAVGKVHLAAKRVDVVASCIGVCCISGCWAVHDMTWGLVGGVVKTVWHPTHPVPHKTPMILHRPALVSAAYLQCWLWVLQRLWRRV